MIVRRICARRGRSAPQFHRSGSVSRTLSSHTESRSADKTFVERSIDLTAPQLQGAELAVRNARKETQRLQDELARFQRRTEQLAGRKSTAGDAEGRRQERIELMRAYLENRQSQREARSLGSINAPGLYPDTYLKSPVPSAQITLPDLLAAQTHLGHATPLWHPGNSSYIFGIRNGIHVISLEITLAHLRRACRVISEVARMGGLILFIGTRPGFHDIVVKAASLSKGYHIFDRWTPGSLTNGQQILGKCRLMAVDAMDNEIPRFASKLMDYPVARPDLVVCLNPLENEVCLHECGLYNVPTVGIVDTDTNPTWVTYPIPANDDSLRSVTLITMAMAMAGQEGQQLRLAAAAEGKLTYQPVYIKDLIDTAEDQDEDEESRRKQLAEEEDHRAAMDDNLDELEDDDEFDDLDEDEDENLDDENEVEDGSEDFEPSEDVDEEPDDADLEQLEREMANVDRNLQNVKDQLRIEPDDFEDIPILGPGDEDTDDVTPEDMDRDIEAMDRELEELDQDAENGPRTIEIQGKSTPASDNEATLRENEGRAKEP